MSRTRWYVVARLPLWFSRGRWGPLDPARGGSNTAHAKTKRQAWRLARAAMAAGSPSVTVVQRVFRRSRRWPRVFGREWKL